MDFRPAHRRLDEQREAAFRARRLLSPRERRLWWVQIVAGLLVFGGFVVVSQLVGWWVFGSYVGAVGAWLVARHYRRR